jgi:hypothetical protein
MTSLKSSIYKTEVVMNKSFVVLLFFWFVGCAPTILSTKVAGLQPVAIDPEQELKVYNEGQQINEAYEVVGKLFVQKRGSNIFAKPDAGDILDLMKDPARNLGAQGLIGFHTSIFCGEEPRTIKRWGGALAVRFADAKTSLTANADFIVSILPVVNADTTLSVKERTNYDSVARFTAQYHLEKLGYYATLSHQKGLNDLQDIKDLPANMLDTLGGKISNLLLLLRMEEVSGTNLGIVAGSSTTLKGYLISKTTRDTVWTGTGLGSSARFGLISVLMSGRDEDAVYNALEGMFATLKPRNQEDQ